MPGWAIGLTVGGIFLFVIIFAVILGNVLQIPERESVDRRTIATDDAGKKAERLFNEKIESMIADELNGEAINYSKFIFFNNYQRKYTTEIDNLVVTKAGIFIIEVKGWKGEITSCGINDQKWMKVNEYRNEIETMNNPIYQNNRHLQKFLKLWKELGNYRVNLIPIVVFPYYEVAPDGTYSIEKAFSYIKDLTIIGKYDIERMKNIISKISDNYGATEQDHYRTWNELDRIHNSV